MTPEFSNHLSWYNADPEADEATQAAQKQAPRMQRHWIRHMCAVWVQMWWGGGRLSLALDAWQAHAYEVSCDLTTEGDGFIARVARHVKVLPEVECRVILRTQRPKPQPG